MMSTLSLLYDDIVCGLVHFAAGRDKRYYHDRRSYRSRDDRSTGGRGRGGEGRGNKTPGRGQGSSAVNVEQLQQIQTMQQMQQMQLMVRRDSVLFLTTF